MYEKLSSRVEKVIELARAIARDGDHEYLGTEHVLMGIRLEGTGLGSVMLDRFGIDEHRLRGAIERHARKSMEETWVFGRLPGTPYLKNVVAAAIRLAREHGTNEVSTEHLLVAMIQEKGSVAQQVLAELGMTPDAAIRALAELEGGPSAHAE